MKKLTGRSKRKKRIKKKIYGDAKRPRVSIFRSNKYIYAQVVDDEKGRTITSVSDEKLALRKKKVTRVDRAFKVGEKLAGLLKKKKLKQIVFDRSGYKYHGRVKAVAEGLRKGGIEF